MNQMTYCSFWNILKYLVIFENMNSLKLEFSISTKENIQLSYYYCLITCCQYFIITLWDSSLFIKVIWVYTYYNPQPQLVYKSHTLYIYTISKTYIFNNNWCEIRKSMLISWQLCWIYKAFLMPASNINIKLLDKVTLIDISRSVQLCALI